MPFLFTLHYIFIGIFNNQWVIMGVIVVCGNASTGIFPVDYALGAPLYGLDQQALCNHELLRPFLLGLAVPIKGLAFPVQVHGAQGICIEHETPFLSFSHEADFLITHLPCLGIGIVSADCLPVIVYSYTHRVIGIAHAGWRGTAQEVAVALIARMQARYNVFPDQLQIVFGPSIGACCYTVDENFIDQVIDCSFFKQSIIRRNDAWYCDLVACNRQQLIAKGIMPEYIDYSYWCCTACTPGYWSYRKMGRKAGRQITVVALVE